MHQNLYPGTLDVFADHARLWWHLNSRQCWAQVTLSADQVLDLGQTGWVVFEKTYNQRDERLMFHQFKVLHLCELAQHLGIDLHDLNYLTS